MVSVLLVMLVIGVSSSGCLMFSSWVRWVLVEVMVCFVGMGFYCCVFVCM